MECCFPSTDIHTNTHILRACSSPFRTNKHITEQPLRGAPHAISTQERIRLTSEQSNYYSEESTPQPPYSRLAGLHSPQSSGFRLLLRRRFSRAASGLGAKGEQLVVAKPTPLLLTPDRLLRERSVRAPGRWTDC